MSTRATHGERGMTLIEVVVTVLVICTGTLATLAGYVHFTSASHKARERAVLASVAQREIEQLRPVDYPDLALTTDPPPQAAAEAPRTGPGAGETLVTGGVVRPGGDAFSVRGVKGRVYRYVTFRDQVCGALNVKLQGALASLLGQTVGDITSAVPEFCPTLSKTKRITVVAVPTNGSDGAGAPLRLTTIVTDPASVLPAVVNDTALAVKKTAAGVTAPVIPPAESAVTQTLQLYDTRCDQASRSAPSSHETRDTSQEALTCSTSGPAPTLMGLGAVTGSTASPVPDFSTDVGRAAPGGAVLQRDTSAGSCTAPTAMVYTNPETDRRRHSLHTWASTAPGQLFQTPTVGGRASLTLWTSTTSAAAAPARLCVTVRRASTGEVIGASDFSLPSWPGQVTQLVTTFDLSPATLGAGERLLLTLRVPSDSGSDLRILYDHPSYVSSLSLTTLAGKGLL